VLQILVCYDHNLSEEFSSSSCSCSFGGLSLSLSLFFAFLFRVWVSFSGALKKRRLALLPRHVLEGALRLCKDWELQRECFKRLEEEDENKQ
jgi:hypothetical protein